MAVFNEILVGRFNKALNDIFSIKAGAPSPSVAGEIMPVLVLDAPGSPDRRWSEGWDRFGFSTGVGALAANLSMIKFRNPSNSNTMIVMEKLRWGITTPAGAGNGIVLNYNNGSAGPDNANFTSVLSIPISAFDSRTKRSNVAVISVQQAAALGITNYFFFDFYGNSTPGSGSFFQDIIFHHDQMIEMLPGSSIVINSNLANTAIEATFWWRERPIEESELT